MLSFTALNYKDFVGSLYHKKPILSDEFTHFECALRTYKENFYQNAHQNEDALVANALAPFLQNLGFKTHVKEKQQGKSEIDLAVMKEDKVGIIIEAKKGYAKKMFSAENVNCEALHEAILYYLRQRNTDNGGGVFKNSISPNSSLKFIIITNFTHFYFFKANEFERLFYKNKEFADLYANFTSVNSLFKGNTKEFYKETEKILATLNDNIKGFHLDLSQLKTDKFDFKIGQIPFKVFHKDFLLDEFNPNDANSLNERFYKELLYILGLQEKKDDSKLLIVPSAEPKNAQNTLYNAIITKLPKDKQDLESTMNFIVLWLNRILFLKLIEANLVRFNDDANLKFLNLSKVPNFKALSQLFFDILAKKPQNRTQANSALAYLPYLNSSLFVRQKCENLLDISALDDSATLSYYAHTQIKDKNAKAKVGKVGLLAYLFEFLDSFDFGSNEDSAELALQKELISSSVLGLVFEKLNGYKEGSFYTPSFITSYMAKTSLEKIVLDKFANIGLKAKDLSELKGQIVANLNADYSFMQKAKDVLLSIKICDPAVGSGHFLVSALNEMIKIYHTLGLSELSAYHLHLNNDEIIITKPNGKIYEYKKPTTTNDENHAIQKALFALKKSIIENNLFGVDINANSVQICRLRLWIELLKSSYYLDEKDENFKPNLLPKIHQMQTLPNIDINIKCGNSLISYFHLNQSLTHYPNIKAQMQKYKIAIKNYKEGFFTSKDMIGKEIKALKESFKNFCFNDKFKKEIKTFNVKCENYSKKYGNFLAKDDEDLRLYISQNFGFFEFDENEARKEFALLKKDYESIFNLEKNKPFEWRFEFPEVLDENGDFMGFDLVVGNPPYGVKLTESQREFFKKTYKTSQTNTASLFIFLSDKILAQNGINTLIVPKSLNYVAKWEQTRNLIAPTLYLLADCSKAWDEVLLEMVIFARYKNKVCQNYENLFLQDTKPIITNKSAVLAKTNQSKPTCHSERSEESTKIAIDCHDSTLAESRNDSNAPLIIDKTFIKLFGGLFINGISQEELNLGVKLAQNNDKLEKFCKNIGGASAQSYLKQEGKYAYVGGKQINRYGIIDIKGFHNKKEKAAEILNNALLTQDIVAHITKPTNHIKIIACIPKNKDIFILNTINQLVFESINISLAWAIINSKLINWYVYKFIFSNSIRTMHLNTFATDKIPIPKITKANQKIADKIISLVDKILALKSKNAEADTSELEKQIDSLVYELYDLSSDEITIIEGK